MTFESISASGDNGIILSKTAGSFNIDGPGTTVGGGGTIQHMSNDGVSLSNVNGFSIDGLDADSLLGIVSISNAEIKGSTGNNAEIINDTGTLDIPGQAVR